MRDPIDDPSGGIALVVALAAEARPLIGRFGLRHLHNDGLTVVYGAKGLTLTVTGPGREAAAAAMARLQGLRGSEAPAISLNVGIAGCGHLPLGTAFMAHAIVDQRSGERHYPTFPFRPPCPTTTVITVAHPVDEYGADCAYDMEASGIFEIARGRSELVHSLKIVSDTTARERRELSARRVEELVESCADQIENTLALLRALTDRPSPLSERDPVAKELLSRCHFTITESRQLLQLMERLRAVCPVDVPEAEHLLTHSRGRGQQVLQLLRRQLDLSQLRL